MAILFVFCAEKPTSLHLFSNFLQRDWVRGAVLLWKSPLFQPKTNRMATVITSLPLWSILGLYLETAAFLKHFLLNLDLQGFRHPLLQSWANIFSCSIVSESFMHFGDTLFPGTNATDISEISRQKIGNEAKERKHNIFEAFLGLSFFILHVGRAKIVTHCSIPSKLWGWNNVLSAPSVGPDVALPKTDYRFLPYHHFPYAAFLSSQQWTRTIAVPIFAIAFCCHSYWLPIW